MFLRAAHVRAGGAPTTKREQVQMCASRERPQRALHALGRPDVTTGVDQHLASELDAQIHRL